jgi:hypothetical protein
MSLRSIAPKEEQERFAVADAAYKKQFGRRCAQIQAIEKIAQADFQPVEHEEFRDEIKRAGCSKSASPN